MAAIRLEVKFCNPAPYTGEAAWPKQRQRMENICDPQGWSSLETEDGKQWLYKDDYNVLTEERQP